MDSITTLILMAGGMLLIMGLITMLGRQYDLNSMLPTTASLPVPCGSAPPAALA